MNASSEHLLACKYSGPPSSCIHEVIHRQPESLHSGLVLAPHTSRKVKIKSARSAETRPGYPDPKPHKPTSVVLVMRIARPRGRDPARSRMVVDGGGGRELEASTLGVSGFVVDPDIIGDRGWAGKGGGIIYASINGERGGRVQDGTAYGCKSTRRT